ncbi:hypothetical protein HD806DRAFT_216797 [Xylariaceae sp. AK1471]|nr:hypothetical protein HD806DRAFT_216797 [Xylariaceae sp. AK1471]
MSFNSFGASSGVFDFNFHMPPPGGPSRSSAANLCPDCASLETERALARAHSLYEGARRGRTTRQIVTSRSRDGPAYLRDFYFVTSLDSRLSANQSCKLCNFF